MKNLKRDNQLGGGVEGKVQAHPALHFLRFISLFFLNKIKSKSLVEW